MKKTTLISLVLLLIAILVFFFFIKSSKVSDILTLYGNVDIREVNLSFRIDGRIEKMTFEEGDAVNEGDVVAILDKAQFLDSVDQSKAEVNVKQAQLNELLAGTREEEIAQARALVKERESTFINAQDLLYKNELGFEAGVISLQELQNSQTQVKETSARFQSAKDSLREAINGPRKENIQSARASLDASKAALSKAEKNLSYTELISPSNGVMVTRVQEPGAVVGKSQTIYTLSLNNPKWIQAYIDEVNLGKIYHGMIAEIKTDSYPDKRYKGQIGFISPIAEFTPKSVETKELRTDLVYRLRVIVKDPKNELRQGMPVTVVLNLNQKAKSKDD